MFNELYWKVDEVATPVLWAVAADYFVPVADPIMAWIKYHHLPWNSKASRMRIYDIKLRRYEKQVVKRKRNQRIQAKLDLYKYLPLPSDRHLRLLSLHPGTSDEPIAVSLATYDLFNSPSFEALSYTWGNLSTTALVICDGKRLPIGGNLYDALHRLRKETDFRVLWADGICMNQEDLAERSSQVLLMRDIYKSASGVLIWLGNESKDSDRGFELIQKFSSHYTSGLAEHPDKSPPVLTAQDFKDLGLPEPNSQDWKAVDAIYWRKWFTRVWVIQEITLAKSATVICGQVAVPWKVIVDAAIYTSSTGINTLLGIGNQRILNLNWHMIHHHRGKFSLFGLLNASRRNISTDPRDQIYGRIGLTLDDVAKGLEVDYSLPVPDLYTSVAIQILRHDGMDLLNSISDSLRSLTRDLPSWAPDWSDPPRAEAFLSLSVAKNFQATANSTPLIRFSGTGFRQLHSRGYIVDTIKTISLGLHVIDLSDTPPMGELSDLSLWSGTVKVNFAFRLSTCDRQFRSLSIYPTGEDIKIAYASTMIASQLLPDDATSVLTETLEQFRFYWASPSCFESLNVPTDGIDRTRLLQYFMAVKNAAIGRRFCVTHKGYMGLVPMGAAKGDRIVLLSGGRTPYVIRKRTGDLHTFLGECYVHGMMHGEKWDPATEFTEFTFV